MHNTTRLVWPWSNHSLKHSISILGTSYLECKTTTVGREYMGQIAETTSGKTCQAWTATSPHDPNFDAKNASNYPDASIEDARNYCRNPDLDDFGGPWCYTTDPDTRWEYCDVPDCDGE